MIMIAQTVPQLSGVLRKIKTKDRAQDILIPISTLFLLGRITMRLSVTIKEIVSKHPTMKAFM